MPAPSFERMLLAVHYTDDRPQYVDILYLSIQLSLWDISTNVPLPCNHSTACHQIKPSSSQDENPNGKNISVLTFLLLNRYVNVFEAIEENDLSSSAYVGDTLDGTIVPAIVV